MRFELISVFAGLSAAAVLPISSTTSSAVPAATPSSANKGFVIPSTHTEGTYMVSFRPDGQAVHTKVSSKPLTSENTKKNPKPKLAQRQDPEATQCAGLGRCEPTDVQAAAEMLAAQCDIIDNADAPQRSFYSLSGDVAFYFCNFSWNYLQCSSALVDQAHILIEEGECGKNDFEGGWIDVPGGGSYGYQLKDQSFCGWGY